MAALSTAVTAMAILVFARQATAALSESYIPASGSAMRFSADPARRTFLQITMLCAAGNGANPFASQSMTLAAWINIPALTSTEMTIAGFALHDGPLLQLDRVGFFKVQGVESLDFASQCSFDYVTGRNLADGTWHHLAFVRTPNLQYYFIDGVLQRRCDYATSYASLPFGTTLNVGQFDTTAGSSNHQTLQGDLDDIRIYKRAITDPADIAAMMWTPPSADDIANHLILYLTFDEAQGPPINHGMAAGPTSVSVGGGLLVRSPARVPSTAPFPTNTTSSSLIVEARQDTTSSRADPVTIALLVARNRTASVVGRNATLTVTRVNLPAGVGTVTINGVPVTTPGTVIQAVSSALSLTFAQVLGKTGAPVASIDVDLSVRAPGGFVLAQHATIVLNARLNTRPVAGSAGNAASLDGVQQYFIAPSLAWPRVSPSNGLSAITVEFWAYLDASCAGDTAFFSLNGNGEMDQAWASEFGAGRRWGRWHVQMPDGNHNINWNIGSDNLATPATPFYGGWAHYAFVADHVQGTQAAIYVNGRQLANMTRAHDGFQSASAPGGYNHVTVGTWTFWSEVFNKGVYDDLRLWNRSLSGAEIRQRMWQQLGGDEPDLFAYWTFDDNAGGVVRDGTRRGNDLVAGGCVPCEPRFYCQPDFPLYASVAMPALDASACIPSAKSADSPAYLTHTCYGGTHCFLGNENPATRPDQVVSSAPIGGFVFDATGSTGQTVGVVLNGSDPDGDPIAYTVTGVPDHGVVQYWNPNGSSWHTITSAPVTLPSARLQVLTNDGDGGMPFTTIAYVVSDAWAASSPLSVRVNVMCTEGTHLDQAARRCVPCPAGTYAPLPSFATSCLACPVNTFQSGTGAVGCDPCAPGRTYTARPGATACAPCNQTLSLQDARLPLSTTLCRASYTIGDGAALVGGAVSYIEFGPLLVNGVGPGDARVLIRSMPQYGTLHQVGDDGVSVADDDVGQYQYAPIGIAPQWVDHVVGASSSADGHPASAVVGAANVRVGGPSANAWSPNGPVVATIVVAFANAVYATGVNVYESTGGGAVQQIEAQRPDGTWATIWAGAVLPAGLTAMRTWQPPVCPTNFATRSLRLTVNALKSKGEHGIDAIQLVGAASLNGTAEILVANRNLTIAYRSPSLASIGASPGYQLVDAVSYEIVSCLNGWAVMASGTQNLAVTLGTRTTLSALFTDASLASVGVSMAVSLLGTVVCLGSALLVYRWREQPIVKAGSVFFQSIMLVGILCGFLLLFLSALFEMDLSLLPGFCAARPFLLSVAFVLLVGSIIVKTGRILYIFIYVEGKTVARVTNWQLTVVLAGMFAVDMLINLVWLLVDPLRAQVVVSAGRQYHTCSGVSPASGYLYTTSVVYKGLLIAVSMLLAVKVRTVPSVFNEAKALSFMAYAISTQCLIFLVLSGLIADNPSAMLFVTCFALALAMFSTWAILFGYKFYVVKFLPEENVVRTSKGNQPGTYSGVRTRDGTTTQKSHNSHHAPKTNPDRVESGTSGAKL
ncbi:G-protein coupled receptors family 3 profile domain-containing protein [Plasmodiophora brassicae]